MRSIGKKNILLVQKIAKEEKRKCKPNDMIWGTGDYGCIQEKVIKRLPVELWDTWEMADQEIIKIINDVIWGE